MSFVIYRRRKSLVCVALSYTYAFFACHLDTVSIQIYKTYTYRMVCAFHTIDFVYIFPDFHTDDCCRRNADEFDGLGAVTRHKF